MFDQDYMTIGSVPTDEKCVQVGSDSYYADSTNECRIFIQQLKRQFGIPPGNARLAIKSFSHDFGTYREVVVWYSPNSETEINYAFKLEAETPTVWDIEAQKELRKLHLIF